MWPALPRDPVALGQCYSTARRSHHWGQNAWLGRHQVSSRLAQGQMSSLSIRAGRDPALTPGRLGHSPQTSALTAAAPESLSPRPVHTQGRGLAPSNKDLLSPTGSDGGPGKRVVSTATAPRRPRPTPWNLDCSLAQRKDPCRCDLVRNLEVGEFPGLPRRTPCLHKVPGGREGGRRVRVRGGTKAAEVGERARGPN